jgi:hypothetical protein
MFVPEMGQFDNIIHKNLRLDDLIFKNASEKAHEMLKESSNNRLSLVELFRNIFFPRNKPQTIAGMLLTSI